MKNTKIWKAVTVFIIATMLLASCGNGKSEKELPTVGILQLAEHLSLQQANDGFIDELAKNGYIEGETININRQNAQGDQANLKSMSEKLVSKSDVIYAIATPAAQALANETSEVPIVFTAVTDAVGAGLVESNEKPGGNITGTSDMAPVEKQINLLYNIRPYTNKVGIIYNSSEANSKVQADMAQGFLEAYGYEVVVKTVTSTNDVKAGVESLVKQAEAIYIPTDNTMAASMATVKEVTVANKVVVIAGSEGDTMAGGLATVGINYDALGRQAAHQAIKILKGEAKAGDIPVETAQDLKLYINEEVASGLGINPEKIEMP